MNTKCSRWKYLVCMYAMLGVSVWCAAQNYDSGYTVAYMYVQSVTPEMKLNCSYSGKYDRIYTYVDSRVRICKYVGVNATAYSYKLQNETVEYIYVVRGSSMRKDMLYVERPYEENYKMKATGKAKTMFGYVVKEYKIKSATAKARVWMAEVLPCPQNYDILYNHGMQYMIMSQYWSKPATDGMNNIQVLSFTTRYVLPQKIWEACVNNTLDMGAIESIFEP